MTADAAISTSTRTKEGQRAVSVVRDSLTGSAWTFVSRATGLGQSIAVATILGATYLGNTYQAINSLPNIIYYQLLAGSLFASILIPPIVSRIDRGDRAGANALARGFFGTLLVAAAGLCLLLILFGPALLHLLTLGVADPATAAEQRRVGFVFLVIFVPQIALYVTAGTGGAVMNAHGRFALAAGAPALENLGMISILVLDAILFGTGTALADVTTPQIMLLGIGTTAAVGVHAAAQWRGARSCDVRLVPRWGWRDPEVRRVLRRVVPTLGYTGLAAMQTVAVLFIANRLAGGLVAFQLSLNFYFLPIAIVTWPIARSMLPHLARLRSVEDGPMFWDELCRAARLASFVTVPMAFFYVVLAAPIARAIAIGQLEADGGAPLVAMSLGALGLGVIGETWFILGTYAFYARENVRAPLISMVVRIGVASTLFAIALIAPRPLVPLVLGLGISAGSVIGSVHLWAKLRAALGGSLPVRALVRTAAGALLMAVPAFLTAAALSRWIGEHELGQIAVVAVATIVGAGVYMLAQVTLKAPELGLLRLGTRSLVRGDDR
jgi:putative peptidoglycan lipid II flippase